MNKKSLAALAAIGMLCVAGCSSDEPSAAPTPVAASTTPATTPTVEPEIDGHQVLSAAVVLEGFKKAKLPVRNDRYNTGNCEQLGCIELLTTDDLTIMTFADEAAQAHVTTVYAGQSYSSGNVVLSYAGARTPDALRPKYQQVLDGLE